MDDERGRVTRRLRGRRQRPADAWASPGGTSTTTPAARRTRSGCPPQDVRVRSELADDAGLAGARRAAAGAGDRWAILVHGRGARREECLRAVPVLHELGFTTLIPMLPQRHRRTAAARTAATTSGSSEWRDVEAAMLHAVEAGAREIVLAGWSMGGAIVLQTLDRSWLAGRVVPRGPRRAGHRLGRRAAPPRRPPTGCRRPSARLSRALMGRRSARRLVGVHEPVDVARTNWVRRADELTHRMLLIHSVDDEFVPVGPSRGAGRGAARPGDLEPWRHARHTKEWNVDSRRWDEALRAFLAPA